MRRSPRRKPSKLALTLSLFFLSTLAASVDPANRRAWKPDTELPGAKFVLGDGKNQGSKVKGYEGEWPLWSSERAKDAARKAQEAAQKASEEAQNSTEPPPSTSSGATGETAQQTTHVCAPIGECEPCPDDVIHLPYCRPYNNRRRVACSPVTNLNDPKAIQAALNAASTASGTDVTVAPYTVVLGHEACGKSARQEARDYFEMIAVIACIAIFSIWAFIQRQKLLFNRQSQQLQSRVTGRRASDASSRFGANRKAITKKRAVRLATSSSHIP